MRRSQGLYSPVPRPLSRRAQSESAFRPSSLRSVSAYGDPFRASNTPTAALAEDQTSTAVLRSAEAHMEKWNKSEEFTLRLEFAQAEEGLKDLFRALFDNWNFQYIPPELVPGQFITEIDWRKVASLVSNSIANSYNELSKVVIEHNQLKLDRNQLKKRNEEGENLLHKVVQALSQITSAELQPSAEGYLERWQALDKLLATLTEIAKHKVTPTIVEEAQPKTDELKKLENQLVESRLAQRRTETDLEAWKKEAGNEKNERVRKDYRLTKVTNELAECREQVEEQKKQLTDKEMQLTEERMQHKRERQDLHMFRSRLSKLPHWVQILFRADDSKTLHDFTERSREWRREKGLPW